jgi:hypothetical protein
VSRTTTLAMIFAGALAAALAFAALPATATTTVSLTDATGTKYQAEVTHRVLQAKTATTPEIDQPAVTIYKVTSSGRSKVWTAPPAVVPTVQRVSKSPMGWLPLELTVSSLGAARLIPSAGDQLVFAVHEASADCGSASVAVIGLGGGHPAAVASVQNPCSLAVAVTATRLILSGPGYKRSDPLCCPSTPKAQASLAYSDGAWRLTPHVFTLSVPPKH